MKRRDFVKALAAASMTAKSLLAQQAPTTLPSSAPPPAPVTPAGAAAAPAPGPVPWMSGLMEVKPLAIDPLVPDAFAKTDARYFTTERMATLQQLCEILLPPIGIYPGALDAGVPNFLDFLIGSSPLDRKSMYEMGLDRLDREARQKFGVPFSGVNKAQADELIRPWLRTWMNDHPPTEPYAKFINVAHSDIRTATINSHEWNKADAASNKTSSDKGLYWFPVDPDIHRNRTSDTVSLRMSS